MRKADLIVRTICTVAAIRLLIKALGDERPTLGRPTALEPNSVAHFLGDQGPLADDMVGLSGDHLSRMAANVAMALNRGDTICVEAPTGVGKSLAYLRLRRFGQK